MGKKSAEEKARRDAVKRYLQQYHAAKREMGILEERRRTLSAELRGPSVYDPWRPAPAARHDRSDGTGAAVLQIADVEYRIERQREDMARTVQGIMDLLDLLPAGSMERTVLALRHIDCKSWERIAADIHMSRSRAIDYYNAALAMLAQTEEGKAIERSDSIGRFGVLS